MGQKVNPVGIRLGIVRGWDSNWYGGKNFAGKIVEDDKIRKYLNAKFSKAGISKIYIERTLKLVTVTIMTARPGLIIGKGGQEVDKVKEELKVITGKEIQINIVEVKRPDLDAQLVAQNIAKQIEGRVAYKKAIKTAISATMRANAAAPKSPVPSISRRAVSPCTRCVPTSTTLPSRRTPPTVASASRCGSAAVSSMASATCSPSPRPARTRRPRRSGCSAVPAKATVREPTIETTNTDAKMPVNNNN